MKDIQSNAPYVSGGFTAFMGVISNMFSNVTLADVGVIVGIIVTIATWVVNWYYKKKDFELRKLEVEGKINDQKNR
ncbi:lysis protein [Rodentibacter trehalosifermentans]|uniref:Lysis protein n=1 Tax=Rodentibacter trehalosifermentans TaxID=1908263 RepID=A0A1V3IT25_9PAST|nr:phage holin [Rodentibacter trehalosifermentans]OOF45266.1 lysis protein [Rodentibacter trehalosifermentans]